MIAGLAATALLAGCGSSDSELPQGLGQTASYQCGSVLLKTQPIDRDLLVTIDDRAYRLSPGLAGQGVKYSGGTTAAPVVFHTEDRAASFSIGFRRLPPCTLMTTVDADADGGTAVASDPTGNAESGRVSTAVTPVQAATPATLSGPQWQVEEIAGVPLLDRSRATLEFGENGSLGGFASCNSYRSSFESAEGGELSLGEIAATRKGCPLPLMQQERSFLSLLAGAARYQIRPDGKLAIETVDGETLVANRN
ncbi:META domain-containing protein [Algihabitans albus]|uniref:META domain-containing protein n=1 Tax=Algihabitans albus TaxID=2164067 RepID=UPI000E5D3B48|nr:META domain-containing protein [Algihabitans albus]